MSKLKITIFILILSFSVSVVAEEWIVPDDKIQKVSPFKFNDETIKKGEMLFKQNCASCHGTPGKANFTNLIPSPGDPATVKFQSQTDGALFHKITAGRAVMPSFKDVLTEDERWTIISYFRKFNPKYVQPEPVIAPAGKFAGLTVKVAMSFLIEKKQIKLFAFTEKDSVQKPLSGVALALYAKRYLGTLIVDEPKTTDDSGVALFNYKDSLPGDKAGNIEFIVRANTEGLENFKQQANLKIGKPNTAKSLIDTRAMWTVGSKAPIWLILAYSLVVIGVWSFLIYIALQVRKIFLLGKKE